MRKTNYLVALLIIVFSLTTKENLSTFFNRNIEEVPVLINLYYLLKVSIIFFIVLTLIYRKFSNNINSFLMKNKTNIVIFLVIFIIMAVFSEFLLSLFNEREYYANNYDYRFRVKLNSDFFRDSEFVKEKQDNELRVFLIGDSYVFSLTEDNYTLDKIMEKKTIVKGKKVNVFNLGILGIGPYDYVKILRRFKDYEPDIVIVGLYVDNDIENYDYPLDRYRKLYDFIDSVFFPNIRKRIKNIVSYSKRERVNKNIIELFEQNNLNLKYLEPTLRREINPSILFKAIKYRDYGAYYRKKAEIFRNRTATKEHIKELRKISNEIGAKFMIIIFPVKYQVSLRNWGKISEIGIKMNKNILVENNIQREIINFCNEENVTCIDLLPLLRRYGNEMTYYPIDEHLNKRGNEIIGEFLSKKIEKVENEN